ncbi:hypothetical protein LJR028_001099 [Rhizobacter sp. LjRoot28]
MSRVTVEDQEETTFHWGIAGSGAYAQVKVRGGRVVGKTAQQLDSSSNPSLCLPTASSFDGLALGIDPTTASARIGCAGELASEMSVVGLTRLTYAWGSVASGPYALLTFDNGALAGRLAQRLTVSAAPSACAPSRTSYESVLPGLDVASVQQRMGCAGQMLNDVLVGGLARQTYAWGDVAVGPYAQIVFDGGLVTGKIALRLDAVGSQDCVPNQARFDALAQGSTLAAAQATLGCSGAQVNEINVDGERQITQSWGDIASGPFVMVTFSADQLTSKLAQRLDGTGLPSGCLPTSATHAALTLGMTIAEASAVVGCPGQLLNEVVTGNINEMTFAWGDVVAGPYQQLNFRNGNLAGKLGVRL